MRGEAGQDKDPASAAPAGTAQPGQAPPDPAQSHTVDHTAEAFSWHLVETPHELSIRPDYKGRPGCLPVYVGSVGLSFRPRRSGSHRGGTIQHHEFSDEDRAKARLIAAAPRLLRQLRSAAPILRTAAEVIADAGHPIADASAYCEAVEATLAALEAVK